ncbi:hypothetical protein FRC10_003556, partial [Ceratobasidium sp. 414]
SVNFLPLSSEDDKSLLRSDSYPKLFVSSAAPDLDPLSQTPPGGPVPNGRLDPSLKLPEWLQFSSAPRPSDIGAQPRTRHTTNPGPIGGSRPSLGMGRNSSSPTGIRIVASLLIPRRRASLLPMSARQSVGGLSGKPAGLAGGDVASFAQDQNGSAFNMNHLLGTYDFPVTFNSVQANKGNFVGNINGKMTSAPTFTSYDYETSAHGGVQSGSTALYQHDRSCYGLTLGNGRLIANVVTLTGDGAGPLLVNRFAGTRLEDLVGEIPALCKDQHGYRYLQKKLDGCCVLQRCIDHASDLQHIQLVTEIMFNALTLVQDPDGNYVVQYILNLNNNRFSDAVIRQFVGNVCALSIQKFSSNVIRECTQVAEHNTRKMLIEELLNRNRLEKLLRDSFGNYCVQASPRSFCSTRKRNLHYAQTALDYADPTQLMLLVEGIQPIHLLIRDTPYGKRIQSKLQREQMESHHQQYGGHNFNQTHAALVNLAMNGNGMGMGGRHASQPPVHHSPLADAYNHPTPYNVPQQITPAASNSRWTIMEPT